MGVHVHGGNENPITPNKAVVFGPAGIPVKEIVQAIREFDVTEEGGGTTFENKWVDGVAEIKATRSPNEEPSTGPSMDTLPKSEEDKQDGPADAEDNAIATLSPKEEPTTCVGYTPPGSEKAKHHVPSVIDVSESSSCSSIAAALKSLEKMSLEEMFEVRLGLLMDAFDAKVLERPFPTYLR